MLYGYTIFYSCNRIQFYCSGCVFKSQEDAENNFKHEWKDKSISFDYCVCFENNRDDILFIKDSRYYREREEREREENKKLKNRTEHKEINAPPKIQFSD